MYKVQIHWAGHWVQLEGGFQTRDDANWCIAIWKQAWGVTTDPFRVVEVEELTSEREQMAARVLYPITGEAQ